MKVDLSEIARTPGAHAVHEFEEPLPGEPDVELAEPARGSFAVTNTGQLLVLRGEATAAVRLQCSRCCEPVVVRLDIPLSEEFSARTGPDGAKAQTMDIEEPERAAFQDSVLDLTELVRQNILIQLPIQPLCKEDCAGICQRCGANLNAGPCACGAAEPRPGPDIARLGTGAARLEGPLSQLKRLVQPRPEGG